MPLGTADTDGDRVPSSPHRGSVRLAEHLARMLDEYEATDEVKSWWFSVADGSKPEGYLDAVFFARVYEQQALSDESHGLFFERLADNGRAGAQMVRRLANVPEDFARDGLFDAVRQGRLDGECPEVAAALRAVRKGWKMVGWATSAARRLVEVFGDDESVTSYVRLWLSRFLLDDEPGIEDTRTLATRLNRKADAHLGLSERYERWMKAQKFIGVLLEGEAHLKGVGEQVLPYFFRQWRDISVWPYMFKYDSTNIDYWRSTFQKLNLRYHDDRAFIVEQLCAALTPEQCSSGALAKLNAFVYHTA